MSLEKMENQRHILNQIHAERVRQDEKWGEQNHGHGVWLAILIEEAGEVGRALWNLRTGEKANLREELIHVAAVAVAWIECMDRQPDGRKG